jgi:hypothetical protein
MLRLFGAATAVLLLVLSAGAGAQPAPKAKDFAADLKQLNGSWRSGNVEVAKGIKGHLELLLEFKEDSTVGVATLDCIPDEGFFVTVGPCVAELKAMDKKRVIVLTRFQKGERVKLGEIAYQLEGDKVKLTSPKKLQVVEVGEPLEVSGEWQRKKADKK